MSEPVTHAEIEDVLSSIRRLVSEDAREAQAESKSATSAAGGESSGAAAQGKTAPRLVLTPALRVSENADTGEERKTSEPEDVGLAAEEDTAGTAGACDLDSDQAGFEAERLARETPMDTASRAADPATETDAGETDQGGSEEAPWKDPWATLYQAAGVQGPDADTADLAVDAGSVEVSEPDWQTSDRVSAVVQKITELETKVAQSKQQWEPDGRSSDPYAGSNIEMLQWQDHVEDEAAELSGYEADETVLEADVMVEHPAGEAAGVFADADSGDRQQDPDMAERIVEEAVTSEAFETLSSEDAFLDEESLREMVADIVREELQGALGERITRNVRKLVRREIHRALAAQDLL
jgi:cell pole-organizing protein PopZ